MVLDIVGRGFCVSVLCVMYAAVCGFVQGFKIERISPLQNLENVYRGNIFTTGQKKSLYDCVGPDTLPLLQFRRGEK